MNKERLFYYEYNIVYYNDLLEKTQTAVGIVAGYDMKNAFNRLLDFYGADCVGSVHLYDRDNTEVLEMDEFSIEDKKENTELN